MKKILIVFLSIILMFSLSACTELTLPLFQEPQAADTAAPPEPPAAESTPEPQVEAIPFTFIPPSMEISDYGLQAAREFLSEFTSIFTGVVHAELDWANNPPTATGRFILGWDEKWQPITTYERPEISYAPVYIGERVVEWGFFDSHGERIYEAPWLSVRRFDEWVSYNFADYFRLFDFDGDGIPEIFIHFSQTFDGGYAGFYQIYRYVDGAYRRLEMKTFTDGEASSHRPWIGWLGQVHRLFWDNDGRVISFINSDYSGLYTYEHIVLTDTAAELHLIAAMGDNEREAWQKHHWAKWGETAQGGWGMLDGWLYNNPRIFGTDIPLIPLHSLSDLEDELMALILESYN